MQFKTRHLLALTTIISVLLVIILSVRSALATRMVVSADHPNGARLRVVQNFTYSGDFFNTSIYFDDGSGDWRWYYYAHEDWYWGSAEFKIIDSQINVSSNKRSIAIDTATGECTVSDADGVRRTFQKSDRIKNLPPGIEDNNSDAGHPK